MELSVFGVMVDSVFVIFVDGFGGYFVRGRLGECGIERKKR